MDDYKIRYSCGQKDWFRNMTGIVINYRHKSEANHMCFIHMLTPKLSIDRVGGYPKNWRWR